VTRKDLPELPKKITDWQIGKPDYVLAMTQAYTVQAHSPDAYVYVTFPTKFKEDKWVQAAEIVPGQQGRRSSRDCARAAAAGAN
jgi:hypothetical protein